MNKLSRNGAEDNLCALEPRVNELERLRVTAMALVPSHCRPVWLQTREDVVHGRQLKPRTNLPSRVTWKPDDFDGEYMGAIRWVSPSKMGFSNEVLVRKWRLLTQKEDDWRNGSVRRDGKVSSSRNAVGRQMHSRLVKKSTCHLQTAFIQRSQLVGILVPMRLSRRLCTCTRQSRGTRLCAQVDRGCVGVVERVRVGVGRRREKRWRIKRRMRRAKICCNKLQLEFTVNRSDRTLRRVFHD